MTWARSLATLLPILVVALCSCAAIDVRTLPQPGADYRDGYDVVMEFAAVLNLPDSAKVTKDGTTVGVVKSVRLARDAVEVTARIDPSVQIPADYRAVLQQATVLGDISVALTPPDGRGSKEPILAPHGRIPLAQTTSPPQLEDTLASLANFVASGSVQRIQDAIVGINKITPESRDKLRAIAARVSVDLSDTADNIDSADYLLNGISQSVTVLAGRSPQLAWWFTTNGMATWKRALDATSFIGTLLPSVGSIYTGGFWAVPFMNSMGNALGEVRGSKQAVENEYRPWRKLFTDLFLPQDKYPAMNIVSVQTADGREISQNVQDVLRMLGAVP